MKIKINTDDLVSHVSVHIAAWYGAFCSWIPVFYIKVMPGTANPYDAGDFAAVTIGFAILIFIPCLQFSALKVYSN